MKIQEMNQMSQETKYELRKQVVRLMRSGRRSREVAEITDMTQTTVARIWKKFQAGGIEAIKMRPKGRQVGDKRRLTPEQETQLQRLMIDKTPEQLRFKFALWTRMAVKEVVLREFKVDLPLRTISHYLKRWGFTVQKPTVRAYEQNPKAVAQWLTETYPSIQRQAKEEGGEIHWGDETGVEASDYARSGYAPKGRTPVVYTAGNSKKTRVNMISSITNQGQVRFMLYEDKMTSEVFLKFLCRLVKDAKKKVFLIVDNLRVHHNRAVSDWLSKDENRSRLGLFFLPSRMKSIQNNSASVEKYFEDPKNAYAA